tara:strand:+ start:113 stop:673 length:561 start_codon:yes stop_codon:yes gene_type:complete
MKKKLPKIYIFVDNYKNKSFEIFKPNVGIIYRNYHASNRKKELLKVAKICKKKRYKLFVSNDQKLATEVKADGIYIPSFNKQKMFLNMENKNLMLIGSAHNQKEIKEKILQKCSAVFLSPLFNVKKSKKFLGIHKFNFLSNSNKIIIYPLGGITEKNINKVKILGVRGFGGISLFKKKTGPLGAGF